MERRWSMVGWKEPLGPARLVGSWRIGARVGKRCPSSGRLRIPARRSGGVPDMTPLMVKSFYSGCYRSFVPEIFNASMTYHAVVLLHTVRGPCSEVHVLPTATMAC
ncbi:hypothetical protein BHM03_00023595 [Ensete ventricosum]|nr:hypothetical protein BHM03_00023595 [Ensete ventricosum]